MVKHNTQDVTIVGSSAAGLYSACALAERGARVRVFEASDAIAPLPRTLIVTPEMLEVVGPIAQPAIINTIRRFELFVDDKCASINLSTPDLVVERSILMRVLAERARDLGVQIVLDSRFVALEPERGGLRLSIESTRGRPRQTVLTTNLIGADGTFSRVAKAIDWGMVHTAPLVQAVVKRPPDLALDAVRVWFVPEDTPYFYWLIPHSETEAVVGLIGEVGRTTRLCLDRFLQKHRLLALSYQAARIPLFTGWVPPRRRFSNSNVYLVGDACAHVKVTTVGGLVTGFKGAQAVVEAISTGSTFRFWQLAKELYLHLLVRMTLQRFTCADYRALFDLLNRRSMMALSENNRDNAGRLLLRLCLSEPKFLSTGLRHLLPNLVRIRAEMGASFG